MDPVLQQADEIRKLLHDLDQRTSDLKLRQTIILSNDLVVGARAKDQLDALIREITRDIRSISSRIETLSRSLQAESDGTNESMRKARRNVCETLKRQYSSIRTNFRQNQEEYREQLKGKDFSSFLTHPPFRSFERTL